ncbi:MAG: hypothetical protein E5V25_06325 [Mesorhizobium sp.]|nr:MAG: hypothetical protein E5V25_06325 [Mesorhizobium sp.]
MVADWIHREIIDQAKRHHIVNRNRRLDVETSSVIFEQGTITGDGPIGAIGLRDVCVPCNNGWMSAIVQAAQPLFRDLMQGRLYPANRNDLAKWAALTAMNVASYLPDGGVADEERFSFCLDKVITKNWYIFLGLVTGAKVRAFLHRPAGIHASPDEQTASMRQDRNCFTLTLCLKSAVIHVLKLPDHQKIKIIPHEYAFSHGLLCIHPDPFPPGFFFKVSPPILTVDQLRYVGTNFLDKLVKKVRGDAPGAFDDWISSRSDEVWELIRRVAMNEVEPERHDWSVKHFRSLGIDPHLAAGV